MAPDVELKDTPTPPPTTAKVVGKYKPLATVIRAPELRPIQIDPVAWLLAAPSVLLIVPVIVVGPVMVGLAVTDGGWVGAVT